MEEAVARLKQLAEDNLNLVNRLEAGKIDMPDCSPERVEVMILTWRYWAQCLLIAAWLLESEKEYHNDCM